MYLFDLRNTAIVVKQHSRVFAPTSDDEANQVAACRARCAAHPTRRQVALNDDESLLAVATDGGHLLLLDARELSPLHTILNAHDNVRRECFF